MTVFYSYLLHKIYKDVTFGKTKRSFNSSPAPAIGQLKKQMKAHRTKNLAVAKTTRRQMGS